MSMILEGADKDLNQVFITLLNDVKENTFAIHKRQEITVEK